MWTTDPIYSQTSKILLIVAKAAEKIVGVIGLEAYGRAGLFRSLCVDQAYRGRGVAKMLNAMIMAYAHMRGIVSLYMFTFDAEKFASKLGFHKIGKNRIPNSIRSTWQFRKLKSRPVVCMMKKNKHLRPRVIVFVISSCYKLIKRNGFGNP